MRLWKIMTDHDNPWQTNHLMQTHTYYHKIKKFKEPTKLTQNSHHPRLWKINVAALYIHLIESIHIMRQLGVSEDDNPMFNSSLK